MKKAQTELIGLAIIIVIIIFVALLYFRFSSSPGSTNNIDLNYNSQAFNLILSLMRTTVANSTISMQDLLERCYEDPTSTLNALTTCDLAEQEIIKIMNSTLVPPQTYNLAVTNSFTLVNIKTCPLYARTYAANITTPSLSAQLILCRPQ